jgi:lipid-A-disaccharide synthase
MQSFSANKIVALSVKIPNNNVVSNNIKNVLIVAGEASGDLHGSNLVRAMKDLTPEISFKGIGGDKLKDAGVETLVSSSDMAVVGLTEIGSKISTIIKTYFELRSILKKNRPDLLILIDYPGFNISLARIARANGVPVLYYISPQLWAWRKGRVKKIAQRVDKMAVILPFEKKFYERMEPGMEVEYVGHPLMDFIPQSLNKDKIRDSIGLRDEYPVIGLLPGSRDQEIKNLLPEMIGTVEILSKDYYNLKCVLPIAPTISPDLIREITGNLSPDITFFHDNIYSALSICDIALVASGTATLETAIMGVPMVIAYRISPVSYRIAKWVVNVRYVGLVNLVAGEEIVPELIQNKVTPQALAEECLDILGNEEKRSEMIKRLKHVRDSLGTPGASIRTARIALGMIRGY